MEELAGLLQNVLTAAREQPPGASDGSLAFTLSMSNAHTVAITAGVASPIGRTGFRTSVLPVMIPRSEAYYWTSAWQAGEAESLEALRRGERVVFDSDDPTDLARWLLADE